MVFQFARNFLCYSFEYISRRARKQITEHCSLAAKRRISTSKELLAHVVNIFGYTGCFFENLRFKRPHDTFICVEHKCQIVLRRLGGRWFHSFALIRAVLDIERLIS